MCILLPRKQIKQFDLKKPLLFSLFLFLCTIVYSQEIRVNCEKKPLNEVLIELRADYGIMFSFDDSYLSDFIISADTLFSDSRQTLDFLLKGLPLRYELNNDVYIIYRYKPKEKARKFIVAGRITDNVNGETLPFSGIQVNSAVISSDSKGNFSFTSTTDSLFRIRISYVGYYILDTIVKPGSNFHFRLMPSVVAMQEIVVEGSVIARTVDAGSSPGILRLNHKVAYFLPGNGDNSLFNLLRLQPGILASGEQASDLIIWGSYEGQSQVIYDGFTVYGMKNFNDNISAVNPYMAKDIKVLKGAFGAEYGERVGGIVDITGTDGNRMTPSAHLSVNNMTINGMASVPFKKKSALLIAYRQTYYELYNPVSFSSSGYGRGKNSSMADYYLAPDYRFRDMNLKYSGGDDSHNYYLSLYGGSDEFSYSFFNETFQKSISIDHDEDNQQFGGTLFYGFRWNNRKNSTNVTLSASSLHSSRLHDEVIERFSGSLPNTTIYDNVASSINEINGRSATTFSISGKHQLESGIGLLYYYSETTRIFSDDSGAFQSDDLALPYLFAQDNINLKKKITLRPGVRLDLHTTAGKVYIQPRLSVLYRLTDHLRLTSAAGFYNQFVAKNMIIEPTTNYRLEWSVCDGAAIKVLNSQSVTMGVTYDKNGLVLSAEGYLKKTGDITRYIESETGLSLYRGDSKTRGIDVFIKKDFRDQTLWLSYTISRTLERFNYFTEYEYVAAMIDQRHELKIAALTRFRSFHFTVNYVFGSGFPDPDLLPGVVDYLQPYSRLDAAIIYNLLKRRVKLDCGVSVLNVLNKENIRYSNYTRIPTDETTTISLYAEAVPLTPTIFLNIFF